MPRRPRLSVPMLDAWRLVLAATEAGEIQAARTYADQALGLSGWDRYEPGSRLRDDQVFYGVPAPRGAAGELAGPARGWGYFARGDGERRLLVHRDAAQLVSDWSHLPQLMKSCEDLGGGLIRLSEALAEVLLHAVTPPDDLSEIRASG